MPEGNLHLDVLHDFFEDAGLLPHELPSNYDDLYHFAYRYTITGGYLAKDTTIETFNRIWANFALAHECRQNHVIDICNTAITFFNATIKPKNDHVIHAAWEKHTNGNTRRIDLECAHAGMLNTEFATRIAQHIKRILQKK